VSPITLVIRGLTDNRAGLILAGLLGFIAQAIPDDDVSFFVRAWQVGQELLSPIIGRGAVAVALFIAAIGTFFVVVGWIGSAVLNVVRFYGFALRESDGVFTRSYGLFTKRVHALPRLRIQAVRLKQTLLRRVLGFGELRTDDMGAGAQEKTAEAQGTDVFVPMAKRPVLEALLPRVLPAADPSRYAFRRTSARIVRRSASRFTLLGVLVAVGVYPMIGWWALAVPFAFTPLGVLWGLATLRTLTWAFDAASGLAVRRGVFRREEAYAPRTRLEALTIVQSPFDRWHGVATLTAIVGGGARVAIPNVPVEEAREATRALMG
jgi:putative membrane protein